MENITLGQITVALAFLCGLIGSIAYLFNVLKKQINKLFEPFKNEIKEELCELDKSQCKNYLVRFLTDVENGKKVSAIEKERAYECFKRYTDRGGNSYVHDWWERLMK